MEIEKLKDVVICKEEDSVLEVSKILRDTGQRHLIVVNGGKEPLGIISTVDINNRVVSEQKNPSEIKASEIMSKPIEKIDVNSSYEEAYQKMIEKNLYSIPITEDGRLIGLLDFNKIFVRAKEKH